MSRRDEVRVIGLRVYHCSTCAECDGVGIVHNDRDLPTECWFCDGSGEARNEDCVCDECMDLCERLDAANLVSLPPMGVEE